MYREIGKDEKCEGGDWFEWTLNGFTLLDPLSDFVGKSPDELDKIDGRNRRVYRKRYGEEEENRPEST
jgi:hypothetical protein